LFCNFDKVILLTLPYPLKSSLRCEIGCLHSASTVTAAPTPR
jgi:hypothetical protein